MRDSVRRTAVREHERRRAQHHDEHQRSEAEHRPIERDATRVLDPANRPEWRQWRERDRDAGREYRSEDDRADGADESIDDRQRRARSQASQHTEVVGSETQLPADYLARDEQGGERGDDPEHPERDPTPAR